MTDTLILFRSKYGASRQYAQWLHEQIPSELAEQSSIKPQNLKAYSQIVLFGGIYAGSIAGVTFLIKHRELLAGKTLAVFAVGASPASGSPAKEAEQRPAVGPSLLRAGKL